MFRLKIIFNDNLNFFIRPKPENCEVHYPVDRKVSIKHIIESTGVPHTEIGSIVIRRKQVDFSFIPVEPETVRVYGLTAPIDVTRPSILRPYPLEVVRFIADANVGKLARFLRMFGIDTIYAHKLKDSSIAELAEDEGRIVLSKDMGLLKHRKIIYGRYIRSVYPQDQLIETIGFFGLKNKYSPFSLCLLCNAPLYPVDKKDIWSRLEPKTRKYFNSFKICRNCKKIYWRGSHYENMKQNLEKQGIHQIQS